MIDFVEKPIEGLKHGPLDFGAGVIEGKNHLKFYRHW